MTTVEKEDYSYLTIVIKHKDDQAFKDWFFKEIAERNCAFQKNEGASVLVTSWYADKDCIEELESLPRALDLLEVMADALVMAQAILGNETKGGESYMGQQALAAYEAFRKDVTTPQAEDGE